MTLQEMELVLRYSTVNRTEMKDQLPLSKLLSASQRKYSQIKKESLSIIFALKKFFQYLYGRKFIIVTDHKPLVTLFASDKPVPGLAANRLARWALFLGQFQYTLEFRKTNHHQNADTLSRLPSSEDPIFDKEEEEDYSDKVCSTRTLKVCKCNQLILVVVCIVFLY